MSCYKHYEDSNNRWSLYLPTRPLRYVRYCHSVWYAMSGTDIASAAISLRARYAVSGTDTLYGHSTRYGGGLKLGKYGTRRAERERDREAVICLGGIEYVAGNGNY
eukprot:2215012-Rhodomonas_salina.1